MLEPSCGYYWSTAGLLWSEVLRIGCLCSLPFLILNISSPAQRVLGCTLRHDLTHSGRSGTAYLLGRSISKELVYITAIPDCIKEVSWILYLETLRLLE